MEWKIRVQCKLRLCLLPSLFIIIAVGCLAYMKVWLQISKSQWFRLVGRVSEILGSIDFMWFAKCITCNITWPYFCILTVHREKLVTINPLNYRPTKRACRLRHIWNKAALHSWIIYIDISIFEWIMWQAIPWYKGFWLEFQPLEYFNLWSTCPRRLLSADSDGTPL